MRYLMLLLLNLPIISLAFLNIITQYKLGRINRSRLRKQLLLWIIILSTIMASFPAYNFLVGRPPFDSSTLSSFDIIQTTAIVALLYILNNQRRKIEQNEKMLKDIHQELSIKLSAYESSKK